MSATSGTQRCLVGGIFTFLMHPEHTFFEPYVTFIADLFGSHPTIDVADFVRRYDVHRQIIEDLKVSVRTYQSTWKIRFIFRDSLPWYITGLTFSQGEFDCTLRRFHLAMEARKRYPILESQALSKWRTFVVPTAQLQTSTYGPDNFTLTALAAVLLTAGYGWPHFLGFSVTSTSLLERTLWKLATALVMGSVVGVICILLMVVAVVAVLEMVLQRFAVDFDVSVKGMRNGALLAVTIVYFSSSIFLIGESFRELFILPPEAFILPSWGDYWPHFS